MSEHDAEVKRLEGMTMIGEDTEIRPAAMSHVKPSEFRYYALRALRHAAEDVATLAAEVERLKEQARWTKSGEFQSVLGEMCETLRAYTQEFDLCRYGEKLAVIVVDDARHLRQQLATARANAMREVREGVEKMERYWPETDDYVGVGGSFVSRAAILALIDALRGEVLG